MWWGVVLVFLVHIHQEKASLNGETEYPGKMNPFHKYDQILDFIDLHYNDVSSPEAKVLNLVKRHNDRTRRRDKRILPLTPMPAEMSLELDERESGATPLDNNYPVYTEHHADAFDTAEHGMRNHRVGDGMLIKPLKKPANSENLLREFLTVPTRKITDINRQNFRSTEKELRYFDMVNPLRNYKAVATRKTSDLLPKSFFKSVTDQATIGMRPLAKIDQISPSTTTIAHSSVPNIELDTSSDQGSISTRLVSTYKDTTLLMDSSLLPTDTEKYSSTGKDIASLNSYDVSDSSRKTIDYHTTAKDEGTYRSTQTFVYSTTKDDVTYTSTTAPLLPFYRSTTTIKEDSSYRPTLSVTYTTSKEDTYSSTSATQSESITADKSMQTSPTEITWSAADGNFIETVPSRRSFSLENDTYIDFTNTGMTSTTRILMSEKVFDFGNDSYPDIHSEFTSSTYLTIPIWKSLAIENYTYLDSTNTAITLLKRTSTNFWLTTSEASTVTETIPTRSSSIKTTKQSTALRTLKVEKEITRDIITDDRMSMTTRNVITEDTTRIIGEESSFFVPPTTFTADLSVVTYTREKLRQQKITTDTNRDTTTEEYNYRKIDVPALLKLLDSVVYNDPNRFNLTQKFNESLQKFNIPTCETLQPPTTTEGPSTINFNDAKVVAKCFVCGLDVEGVPFSSACADAFAGDFIPLVPLDPKARGQIAKYRKYCRYLDVNRVLLTEDEPQSVFGRFTGGCSVRWVDLTSIYTQRSCRNRRRAVLGRHFASKRMAKLEMALNDQDNGCIISPVATLLPLSRGISMYARFHACVCTGSWCNKAVVTTQWMTNNLIMFVFVTKVS